MGLEYYLTRPDNKTLFELGKGMLNAAFVHLKDDPAPLDPARITGAIWQAIHNYSPDQATNRKYSGLCAYRALTWSSSQLIGFCNGIAADNLRDNGWTVTGSRYNK